MTISFEPTEEQRLMRDTVAQLAREKLRPRARQAEEARGLGDELRKELAELGLGMLWVPEAHGGAGTSPRTAVLVVAALGWGDAGAAVEGPGPRAMAHALIELGDEEQQGRHFAPFAEQPLRVGGVAWSEARGNAKRPGFSAVARRDGAGWILDGMKKYVLGAGVAESLVVFAQVDEDRGWDGVAAFVVDATAGGVEASARHDTTGLDAARFGAVALRGVRVADRDRLLGGADFGLALRRFFARQSLVVAARAVGLGRAAGELARDYADERRAFGKPIGHFQAIAFMLADRLMDVDGARGLVWRAAWTLEGAGSVHWKKKHSLDVEVQLRCAEAIAEAGDVAVRCGDDAVQIHGGAGFVRDFLAEKLFRDAKQLALCAPSATTADQLFAAIELGAPLDAALVLPTPDLQPIFT
ncbi:MAG: acyl-CoA dehydrogenase family protein [Polyangiales bacterium]